MIQGLGGFIRGKQASRFLELGANASVLLSRSQIIDLKRARAMKPCPRLVGCSGVAELDSELAETPYSV